MMNMRQVSAFKEDKKRVKKKLDVLQHEFSTTEEFSEIRNDPLDRPMLSAPEHHHISK